MARALIVACGCRGRELGTALLAAGWQVRGTTRDPENVAAIEAAGIEAAIGDPDRASSILDQIGDVSLIYWLLGSAVGEPEAIADLRGPRLERLMEEIVDTPVRGFVYETPTVAAGSGPDPGVAAIRSAHERWRIPVAIVDAATGAWEEWRERMLDAAERLTGSAASAG